jgi:hypothetical protein
VRPYAAGSWREVIGVVADSRDDGVDKKAPKIAYWPMLTTDFNDPTPMVQRSVTYLIRSNRTGSTGFVAELGQAVWSINPNLPLASVRTLRDVYDQSLARTSFTLVMLGIAGGMALLLGVAGIYGVISYSVTQRTREIGIRIALGARSQEVAAMFVRHGLSLAAVGVAIGLLACVRGHAADDVAVVRSQPGRSVDLRCRGADAGRGNRAGELRSGLACDWRRPGGGAASGVADRPFRLFVDEELKDVRARVMADDVDVVFALNDL